MLEQHLRGELALGQVFLITAGGPEAKPSGDARLMVFFISGQGLVFTIEPTVSSIVSKDLLGPDERLLCCIAPGVKAKVRFARTPDHDFLLKFRDIAAVQ